MAAGGQMAEFFATLGFKINKGDIQKVDKQLDILEARAKRLSEGSLSNIKVNISRFGFSDNFNTRLHKALQARMKLATSKGISAEVKISKFDVDHNELLREMRDAVRYVEQNLRVNIRSSINRPSMVGGGAAGGAQGAGISRFGAGMGAGAAAGNLGRGFIPGLGVAFGVSQMNRLNQQLIGQDLAATAVFGDEETGQEQLGWLRNLGNKIGFDYRSQANPYLKMQASAQTAGMDMEVGQHIFRSMAEYGRVMGLGDEDMKGTMRAVEQMLNKGQVYAEELKMQLAEKFPAAIQLMAEAVAGGDTEKLFEMMEAGEIVSLEALPKFADILARQARVGGALNEAMKTSLAEQMRFNNTFNDLVMEFSEAGFEEGQAGIFRTMSKFFMEMLPLLRGFGEAWKYIESVLRVPLGLLVDLSTGLESLSDYTGITSGKLLAMGTVLALLAFPLTRTFTLVTMLIGAFEDFTAFMSGRGSLIGQILGDESESTRQNFLSLFETLGGLLKTIKGHILDIIGLFSETDLPFITALNGLVESLEGVLSGINGLLGGDDKQQRLGKNGYEHPLIRQAMMGSSEKSVASRGLSGLATYIEKNPFMIIPRSLGMGDALNTMSNYFQNMQDDERARNDRLQSFRPDLTQSKASSTGISQFFDLQINVDGSNGDRQTAENINFYLQEMLRGASQKAASGSE